MRIIFERMICKLNRRMICKKKRKKNIPFERAAKAERWSGPERTWTSPREVPIIIMVKVDES